MSQQKTSSLKTYFDEIEETNGDDECRAWLNRIFDSKDELATFVAARREGGGAGRYVGFLKGSFNLSFRFAFDDEGPDAIIRFPKPGHTATALRDEKVANEVQVMEYLSQNTTIPLPRVHSWGLTAESPQKLGPFIIMDFVEGTLLSTVLKQQTENEDEDLVLNPDIDDAMLDKIYYQIADYMLQLSRLAFPRIGAISKDGPSNTWSVTSRPLTYNMNELATVAAFPTAQFPHTPFSSTSAYLASLASTHLTHLTTQRNLASSPLIARQRFIARHRFAQLIPLYSPTSSCDEGPFPLFCDDLRPANMLIDPSSLRIKALLDWEFTNAMPAQFADDPPWWLLLSGPERWLERGEVGGFMQGFEGRLEQFLRALRRVEEEGEGESGTRLSQRMREAWTSRRFWFDYAARKSFDVDAVYWAVLHEGGGDGVEMLDEEERAEMEAFTRMKMEQLREYREECRVRFA